MVSRKFPIIVIMKIHLLKEMVEYTHSRLKKKKKASVSAWVFCESKKFL